MKSTRGKEAFRVDPVSRGKVIQLCVCVCVVCVSSVVWSRSTTHCNAAATCDLFCRLSFLFFAYSQNCHYMLDKYSSTNTGAVVAFQDRNVMRMSLYSFSKPGSDILKSKSFKFDCLGYKHALK